MEKVAGGLFNAFAFAGASFLMSKLGKQGYSEEMKRHNLAMERYTRERDIWNEKRLHELDRVNTLHSSQKTAEEDRKETLRDFSQYARLTHKSPPPHSDLHKKIEEIREKYKKSEPKKENFYVPSHEMQEYITLMKYLGAGVVSAGLMMLI